MYSRCLGNVFSCALQILNRSQTWVIQIQICLNYTSEPFRKTEKEKYTNGTYWDTASLYLLYLLFRAFEPVQICSRLIIPLIIHCPRSIQHMLVYFKTTLKNLR